jgi:dihydrolipoamide dehydrogenase
MTMTSLMMLVLMLTQWAGVTEAFLPLRSHLPSNLLVTPNGRATRSSMRQHMRLFAGAGKSAPAAAAAADSNYDYDIVVVGCGVGGHGAALHARANGLKTAVLTGGDVGGTCVNRGCVPSKALLAASGRVRELKNEHHLKSFGITVGNVQFDRQGIANHATQLANNVKINLEKSLKGHGCEVIHNSGLLTSKPHEVLCKETGKIITGKNIIISTGSIPTVPRGITVDEKTVCTSDSAVRMEYVPQVSENPDSTILHIQNHDLRFILLCSTWPSSDLELLD